MSLEFKVEEPTKGAVLVAVSGEVDLQSSPELRAALAPHLKKKGALIVDLSQVAYIDSSGIATLVEAMKLGQKTGTRLRLAAPSPPVLEVLTMAHLDKIFDLRSSREEALKDLR